MKRKVLSLILALGLLLGLAISASAVPSDARNGVAVVQGVLDTDIGIAGLGQGSGFFVSDQYLITNYHVVDLFVEYGAGDLNDYIINEQPCTGRAKLRVYYDSMVYEEGYLVGYDAVRDVAILRLDHPTTYRVPLTLKPPTQEMVGSTIYAIGFPGLSENIYADSTSRWGLNDSTVTSGSISRLITQSGTGQRNVQIDCDIKPGNSGGPVVDESGAVVGIATWSVTNKESHQSVNYAVNIEDAILLMNQYQVPYTIASNPLPTPVTPGSGDVTEESTTSDTTDPAKNDEEEEEETNLGLIIGIAVAVVAVVICVVVVIVIAGKKKPAPQPVPAPVQPPVQPQKVPTIRSFSRANYGSQYTVSSQPILIGRNGACTMRFPNDAPGISGTHCSVQWDAGSGCFIVTDLNSSYGTFLSTGQKMNPNAPYRLMPGDKFYLADQKNTISLELV